MQEDFLTRIRSSYNQFTKAERRVADFILQNPNKVLFMSISDLAETCDGGDTSVFRFCKTMNVKGYQEFKMTLSLSMRGKEKAEGLEDNGEITLGDSISDLAAKVLQDTISSIQESFSLLDFSKVSLAMDAMSKGRRILFFGVGASMLTAMKAMNKFHRIEPISLLCGANVGSLQKGSTSAEISQLFLVDIMYTEYYRRHFEKCSQILEKTSKAISDRN